MSVINRVPKGFLSTLDAKTGGRTPANTAEVLSPTIDLTDYYLSDLTLQGASATKNLAIGDVQTFETPVTVPAGELWLVKFVSVSWVALGAATNAWFLSPAILAQTNGTNVQRVGPSTGTGPLAGTAIGSGITSAVQFERPFFLRAGAQVGIWVDGAQAGAGVVSFTEVSYYRLDV